MSIYILLSTLTNEGRETVKNHPERIKEVDQEIEKMGAKVLAQYVVLGKYDFVNIVEAPNNDVIRKISIELGSRGTVQIITLPAIPIFEFIEKMEGETSTTSHPEDMRIPPEYEEKMY